MENLVLNKNLIMVKKEVDQQQTMNGIIVPGQMNGLMSYGQIVAHGGIQVDEKNDSWNNTFAKTVKVGATICYYKHRQSEILMNNGMDKYHLINVMDIVYIRT